MLKQICDASVTQLITSMRWYKTEDTAFACTLNHFCIKQRQSLISFTDIKKGNSVLLTHPWWATTSQLNGGFWRAKPLKPCHSCACKVAQNIGPSASCGWSTSMVPAFPDDIGRQAGRYALLRHCIKKPGLPLHHHTRATIDDSRWISCCIRSPLHNFTIRKTRHTREYLQCWQQLLNKAPVLLATPIHTDTTNIHPASPYIYEPWVPNTGVDQRQQCPAVSYVRHKLSLLGL